MLGVGAENISLSTSRSQFVSIGPVNIQRIFMAKIYRDFSLAREIIHDHKFSFYAIFLTGTRKLYIM